MTQTLVTRRGMLTLTGTAAGGMILAQYFPSAGTSRASGAPEGQIGLYIQINRDNSIALRVPSAEMGQGVLTSMAMTIAEELDADWDKVTCTQLPLMLKKRPDGQGFTFAGAPQGAGGSNSTIASWTPLRQAGAQARDVLVRAAAARWKAPAGDCTVRAGVIAHRPTGRTLTFGAVAADAAKLPLQESVPLKDRKAYRILGRPVRNIRARDIATGALRYGIDFEIPGMLYAVVEHAPQFDAQIVSIDDRAVRAMPGVVDVVRLDGPKAGEPFTTIIASGVAVVARTLWQAMRARQSLKVTWGPSPWADESTQDTRATAARLLAGTGQMVNSDGDFAGAIAKSARVFERRYEVPYLAHATLEPQNCIAHFKGDSVEIHAPTQFPARISSAVAQMTGLERDKISINMLPMGGGFGRRLEIDVPCEAVLISRAVKAPVQVVWTREDDFRHDFYRPNGFHHLIAGVDPAGRVTAWKHRLATAGKNHRRSGIEAKDVWQADLYEQDFPGKLVANFQREFFLLPSGAPRRSWRAPGHTSNAFAVQCFIDEIALSLGKDPLDLMLSMLGDGTVDIPWWSDGTVFNPGRLAGVLKLAAKEGQWGKPAPKGKGQGIAGFFTFSSYCAHVVDVAVDPAGRLTIERVTTAIDCGLALNPLGIRAQCEGGIIDGLSAALGQEITVKNGQVEQSNFDSYEMLRIDGAPRVMDVHIVESSHGPTGVGEPPTPPLAPALCNAIFRATGKRIRKLPIGNQLRA